MLIISSLDSVFLLVSLKRSLIELDVAFNPSINNDAVPALIILRKLRFLTLLDTRITMVGLRILCSAVQGNKYPIELEVPRECEIYVERKFRYFPLHAFAKTLSNRNEHSVHSSTHCPAHIISFPCFLPLYEGTQTQSLRTR